MIPSSIRYLAQGAERYVTGNVEPCPAKRNVQTTVLGPAAGAAAGPVLFQRNAAERQAGVSFGRHGPGKCRMAIGSGMIGFAEESATRPG